eukprot:TRINITY_DN9470_c0_g1_i2.p1 TRINITY_DN9470_c0_g1~~TRINITY_DN9470_c0_g1_i2.p1  ORF type:complete len:654 (+),score=125.98 TRINITY_DN9470_c0_g1_i2:48-2009(+)
MSGLLNVEFALLAEFDIDKGVTIKQQYPRPCPLSTDVLGSLMLPDGGHHRESDCVTFIIRAATSAFAESAICAQAFEKKRNQRQIQVNAFTIVGDEHQSIEKEGTDKSLITFQSDGFLISNPQTSIKVEYFKGIESSVLEPLFHSIRVRSGKTYGLRFPDSESEATFVSRLKLLGASDAQQELYLLDNIYDLQSAATAQQERDFPVDGEAVLYCICLVRTVKDPNLKRGAAMKSLALCSYFPFVHIYKDMIEDALTLYFQNPSEDIISDLFYAVNMIDFDELQKLTQSQKRFIKGLWLPSPKPDHQTLHLEFNGKPYKLRAPLCYYADEVGDVSVIRLIRRFPTEFMHIINCILMEKRILFVGTQTSVQEICNSVLSCLVMVSPPLKFLIRRAYPYASLFYISDLSDVPGYIAGVSNPMFEEKMELWDMLCDCGNGRVVFSPFFDQPSYVDYLNFPFVDMDKKFSEQVLDAIDAQYGETRIRAMIQAYVRKILNVGTRTEYFTDSSDQRRFEEVNRARIEYIQRTLTFQEYEQALRISRERFISDSATDFHVIISRLRSHKQIPEPHMVDMYDQLLRGIQNESQLADFLATIPEIEGGLTPIALGLFHKSSDVRQTTFAILKKVEASKSGRFLFEGLNFFLRSAYDRQRATLK